MEKLTTAGAKSLSKPGMYRAETTLYLNVAKGGSKSWIQRIAIGGRRHDIGLGPFPVIGLAEARRRAFANRVAIAEGRDPLADRRKAKVPTFREAAVKTFEANRPRWRNTKTTANWMQGMEKRVFPVIGDLPVDRIGREDVLRILTPVWTAKPEIARKLRERIRATLRWAQAHGHVENNVAGEAIAGRAAGYAAHQGPFPSAALSGGPGGAHDGGGILGDARGQAVSPVPGTDRLPVGGSSGRNLERDRFSTRACG